MKDCGRLVLTRNALEEIVLLNTYDKSMINLRIVEIYKGQARIAIYAPKKIKIFRNEVLDRILDENNGNFPWEEYKE